MEKENSFEIPSEKTDKILKHQEDGCLFYDFSDCDIEILESRLAKDTNLEEKFNNDEAVFASKSPLVCIFALQKCIDDGINKKIIPSSP